MQTWSYRQLFAAAELVIIAQPIVRTRDTPERSVILGQPVVGVATEFRTLLVLKGRRRAHFTLHHYRMSDPNIPLIDAPAFAFFDPAEHPRYLLFLVHESDGRFAPVAGQEDPLGLGVQELSSRASD